MKKSRYTETQTVAILQEADPGGGVKELCRFDGDQAQGTAGTAGPGRTRAVLCPSDAAAAVSSRTRRMGRSRSTPTTRREMGREMAYSTRRSGN